MRNQAIPTQFEGFCGRNQTRFKAACHSHFFFIAGINVNPLRDIKE
jgi:hypothetical protein